MFERPELTKDKFYASASSERTVKLHGHEFLELAYLKIGRIDHFIAGERYTVESGQYFIVDYTMEHSYRSLDGGPVLVQNLLFFPEFVDRTLAGLRKFEDVVNSYLVRFSYKTLSTAATGVAFSDPDGRIGDLVDAVFKEYADKKPGYLEYVRSLLVQILISTMRMAGSGDRPFEPSDTVSEITEYVGRHYPEKISLTELSKRYNYSLSHISRKFAAETGTGFSDYVQRIRMENACRMLENGDMKISEVAQRCGYENLKFFNSLFKQTLGMTPREFKKLYKK